MGETAVPVALIRFGVFELDLRAGELRKNGAKLKLEGQPVQVLALLLEHPGQLVSREEVRGKLWPDDTFVDFEHSINTAIRKLRQTLDDSAETPRFIETLPRRGYRFIYPVNGAVNGAHAEESAQASPVWGSRRAVLLCLAAAVLLLAVGTAVTPSRLRDRVPGSAALSPIHSVAVLPLENLTGDPEQEYVVDGVHDELVTQMAQIGALTVISRTSVLGYKGTKKKVPEIARELNGVDAVIEGAVRRDGEQLRVTAQLVDAASDRHLWARSYERPLRDVPFLPKEIAADIASALRIKLSQQEQAALKPGKAVDPAVYAAYLKGKHHLSKWTNEGLWQAIRYFQQAVDLDPTYAPAWVHIGEAYEFLGSFARSKDLSKEDATAKAKAALERAVELDPSIREPHQSLARIKRGEGDWEGAAREFQRARELDPKWLGPETYLVATGRYDEAVAASRQNAETNPLDYSVQLVHGHTYFMAGRYDESIAQLKKTVQLDPDIPLAHMQLAWNYIKKGKPAEAVAECETARALLRRKQPDSGSDCGWVYAAAGRREQAVEIARQLAAKNASRGKSAGAKPNKNAFMLAKIYDALGDRERALAYLRMSQDSAVRLGDNRFFSDQIKADPRFQELSRKQPGFPPATGALAEVRTKAPPVAPARQQP